MRHAKASLRAEALQTSAHTGHLDVPGGSGITGRASGALLIEILSMKPDQRRIGFLDGLPLGTEELHVDLDAPVAVFRCRSNQVRQHRRIHDGRADAQAVRLDVPVSSSCDTLRIRPSAVYVTPQSMEVAGLYCVYQTRTASRSGTRPRAHWRRPQRAVQGWGNHVKALQEFGAVPIRQVDGAET